MEQVSNPTSVPRLREVGWIGADMPHTKENYREEPKNDRKITQLSFEGSVR
jgi:hypothetical protein